MDINNSLADKIKQLRIKSGMTQTQLANKLKISPSTVGMYEQGRRKPDNKTLSKICKIFDASGDYMLDLDKPCNKNHESNEVYRIIADFTENLERQNNLMFNGEPVNNQEKKKIINALKIAAAITLSEINCDA